MRPIPTTLKPKIIVFGIAFWYPLAGVTFQFLHYLLGLRRLGYDPYYIEDSSRWVYDPSSGTMTPDAQRNVDTIAPILEAHGFGGRWAYRGADAVAHGLAAGAIDRLYAEADACLNVTGSQELSDSMLGCPRRIYVESDPVANQLGVALGNAQTIARLAQHDTHFSFGENLGTPDCGVPVERFTWLPTRQPVVLDLWHGSPAAGDAGAYTTIASWSNRGSIDFQGETYYWSKEREFRKIIDLPERCPTPFEIALGADASVLELLDRHRWRHVDSIDVSRGIDTYRSYIQRSRAEFTVAKDQYIRLNSGWFSDRSACYLAAGRPVITQDTGFGRVLPTGRGLFAFRTIDDILEAVEAIESDYASHCAAAREIAETYFAAERVIGSLMERAGL